MKKPKQTKREKWMEAFESYVVEAMPEARGKVEWDSAIYFFNAGFDPASAAFKYTSHRLTIK